MLLSRNKIKHLNALQIKKYRNLHGEYIIEGDKLVSDILSEGVTRFNQLIATKEWLAQNQGIIHLHLVDEIIEADIRDIARVSALETPSPVLAVLDLDRPTPDPHELSLNWSLALDDIQDPGNLGTIIRTADWFGISHILCSPNCVDCYNPKVIQSSMGALLHVKVYYTELGGILGALTQDPSYPVFGTFITGTSVYDLTPSKPGIIIFGNESRGISHSLQGFIRCGITIPATAVKRHHIESLNVASAVAIICAFLVRE